MNNEWKKKTGEELSAYMMFRRRGTKVNPKKGKGHKYNRAQEKARIDKED